VPVVLGIETSCDETGVGVVADGILLGDALATSMDEHARFGGVVPRSPPAPTCTPSPPLARHALDRAGIDFADIGAVATTAGPGLATAVQVGLAAGKAYALILGVPLHGVHHLAGHAAVDILDHGPLPERSIALIVSGGHTSLLLLGDLAHDPVIHLGDAAGEAFDKVARLLGLPYPGGPAIDAAARDGDPTAFAFPRPTSGREDPPYRFPSPGSRPRWPDTSNGTPARCPSPTSPPHSRKPSPTPSPAKPSPPAATTTPTPCSSSAASPQTAASAPSPNSAAPPPASETVG
jgi:N6-L-threonylcarbamoyladenine synthase